MGALHPGALSSRCGSALAVALVLGVTAAAPAVACGWWGDGEEDGPDAVVVEPGGTDASARTPAEMARLSRAYRLGLGVTRDEAQARRWAWLAAKGGDPGGMNDYATMLEQGIGGGADPAEARRWFRKAAEAGYAPAQHSLAMMLRDGRGGPADPKEASLWLGRAAEGGHVSAEVELAEELWERGGAGAARKACFWWLVALESGAAGTPDRCLAETPPMSARDLAEIADDARAWTQDHRPGQQAMKGNGA